MVSVRDGNEGPLVFAGDGESERITYRVKEVGYVAVFYWLTGLAREEEEMASVSRVFGACRVLMEKAASSSTSGISSGREGKGILKVLPVSEPLAKFIGANEVARTTAVKKIWEHIKLNNLQNPENKREILCDGKLKTIFNGKDKVGFLEIAKLLSQHFRKAA
ncbi:unnamed protein product [Microthlaspi erraticum]|uniref:DM2 domain-containing protein n=1 Tax=Microthlaspi erraticum TaxID=1685480 RepID=A0A6D2HXA9_9BRAS|nr:unnamed protein product [Microthlaspi erraticum]